MPEDRPSPTYPTKIQVYILSGGKCAWPDCDNSLVEEDVVVGQVAHIYGLKEGSARFDPNKTVEQLNHPNNLMAMCSTHHTIIDAKEKESEYTVGTLQDWKRNIEKWARDNTPSKTRGYLLLQLLQLDAELDKNRTSYVFDSLNVLQSIVKDVDDGALTLEFELINARTNWLSESVSEAIGSLESLAKMYPNDVRPLLSCSDIYSRRGDLIRAQEYLAKAEDIDSESPLLLVGKLLCAIRSDLPNVQMDTDTIDEDSFPEDSRLKSNIYRLYAILLIKNEDIVRAEEFIEKALYYNPNNVENYLKKLYLKEVQVLKDKPDNEEQWQRARTELDDAIEDTISVIDSLGADMTLRNMVEIEARRANYYYSDLLKGENGIGFNNAVLRLFGYAYQCDFDEFITSLLVPLLSLREFNDDEFEEFNAFLRKQDCIPVSLLAAFLPHCLLTENRKQAGLEIMKKHNCNELVQVFNDIEQGNTEGILSYLKHDDKLIIPFLGFLVDNNELRYALIQALPKESDAKNRLLIRHYATTDDIDSALELAERVDTEELSGQYECDIFARIYHDKERWEDEAECLRKWLDFQPPQQVLVNVLIRLFFCYLHLEDSKGASETGNALLEMGELVESLIREGRLSKNSLEQILAQTILSLLRRGEYENAVSLLEKYESIEKSQGFLVTVEVDTYIKARNGRKAYKALLQALELSFPSPELFAMASTKFPLIDALLDGEPEKSLENIKEECFFKISENGSQRWNYIGNESPLDAHKIQDSVYIDFLGKKIGEQIVFDKDKFASDAPERIIADIASRHRYVRIRAMEMAYKLAKTETEFITVIEIPHSKDDIPDFSNLETFLKEDSEQRDPFRRLYAEKPIPFAFLVATEGGIENALGQIREDNNSFIRFSTGTMLDLEQQKANADLILSGKQYVLDGTSALFLADSDKLETVIKNLPNLIIPQSVINMLQRVARNMEHTPGSAGGLGYINNKMVFNKVSPEGRVRAIKNLNKSIKLLESGDVRAISAANRSTNFCETRVPPELVDACVLSQKAKQDIVVLTEDPLYLRANSLDTGKECPDSCSSLILLHQLWKMGAISFNDYIDYFFHLSAYRFKHLLVTVDEIWMAVFGENKKFSVVQPEMLRKLNFRLILSEKYGIVPTIALRVVGGFLMRVIMDESITEDLANQVFSEVIPPFLVDRNKGEVGEGLIDLCAGLVGSLERKRGIHTPMPQRKLAILAEKIRIYILEHDPLFDSQPKFLANTEQLGMDALRRFDDLL